MDWFERIPKVELHLHLEGAIPATALGQLVEKYGGRRDEVAQRLSFRTFPEFIQAWIWKNQFLREYEDFAFIAEAVARSLAEQNIVYAEMFFSPSDFARHGLQTQPLTEAIRRGLSSVPAVEVALIADLVRDSGAARASRTLAELRDVSGLGVIGVGLGGSEHEYPAALFTDVFAEARRLGFHVTAHAGEAAGAASIWEALRSLHAERIGHGVRAEEDPALLDWLVEHRVPLEMCPLSNVRTGVVLSLEAHPVRRYHERGVVLTINTDDPAMFGSSLALEYRGLCERLGFSKADVCRLALQAVDVSWASPETKTRLRHAFATASEASCTGSP